MAVCNRGLYALKTLKSHGLDPKVIATTYCSIITTKLLYASPAWWVYTISEEKVRLEKFLSRSKKLGFCALDHPSIEDLALSADSKLLKLVCSNPRHLLHSSLPPQKSHIYSLRSRHDRQ